MRFSREDISVLAGRIASGWRRAFEGLLSFLDEHAVGVLATLVIHLARIVIFLFLQISSLKRKDEAFYVDLSVLSEVELQQTPKDVELAQSAPVAATERVRDIPVNVARAENRAVENISKMVEDIKSELNVKDLKLTDPEDTPPPPEEETTSPEEARIYDDKYPLDASGERTVYDGPTHVSYRLEGRTHTRMRVPAYKCRGAGRIVVDIVVNPRGYVVSAVVNKALSDTEEPCFVDAARSEAEKSRFNADSKAPERQAGTITYLFEAQ